MQPHRTTARPRVAYLVSQYPAISHAFIEREIQGLRAQGYDVDTFTVRPCPHEHLISASMREEYAHTQTLIGSPAADWVRAHASLALRHPGVWARGLVKALRTGAPHPKTRLWQAFYFAEAVLLLRHLRERNITHLHVHMSNVAADVARLVITMMHLLDGTEDAAWTLTIHGHGDFEIVDTLDLEAKIASAHGVSAITDYCRSQLMRYSHPRHWNNIAVVPMSIDTERFRPPLDGRLRDPHDPVRLLFVGRLSSTKGGPLLLDAVHEAISRGVPCELRIIGQGELDSLMREHVQQLGLQEHVTFMGALGQDELPHWYHWADVFVLPSFQEGLPVVLMEAMATELPVITSAVMGIPELVINGRNGYALPPGRADLIADAIAELHREPERRHRYGLAGRHDVIAAHRVEDVSQSVKAFFDAVRAGLPVRTVNDVVPSLGPRADESFAGFTTSTLRAGTPT